MLFGEKGWSSWQNGGFCFKTMHSHILHMTTEVLADISGTPVECPRYSPDLASCDFWAFPMLRHELWWQKFSSVTEVKQATSAILHKMSANGLLHMFEMWARHCKKCIACERFTSKKKQCPTFQNPQIVSYVSVSLLFKLPSYCSSNQGGWKGLEACIGR
jgi:hypothetical protein